MKYIIKNCPAILKATKICDAYNTTHDNPQFCKDISDCVLKQVVNRCKQEIEQYKNTTYDATMNSLHFGRQAFAFEILQVLEFKLQE